MKKRSHNILKNVAHKMGGKQTEVLNAFYLIMNNVDRPSIGVILNLIIFPSVAFHSIYLELLVYRTFHLHYRLGSSHEKEESQHPEKCRS